jgi:hypothetical protein
MEDVTMKKNYKKITKLTNAIDPATTTSKDWGFNPIPGKGGKTTNTEIHDWMFQREKESGDAV